MADRKLFPFLNEIRAPIRRELIRRRNALTEIVTPFARFTSIKEKETGTTYRYFHIGLEGAGNFDEINTNIFDLSYGSEDVVGFAYASRPGLPDQPGGPSRIPISLEDQDFIDPSEGRHPIPGITAIFVEHKGANAPVYFEVKWVCYNIGQLDFLRQHFMVAGSYVAIEYGQLYAGLDGTEIYELNNRIESNQYEWARHGHSKLAEEFVMGRAEIVRNYAAKCGGNYDIWVGQIVDYEIEMREDGSYECTTRAYSTGEALFGISTNTPMYSFKNSSDEDKKAKIPYSQVIKEYFKPFGDFELLIHDLAAAQEKDKESGILVVNTTSNDLSEALFDNTEGAEELFQIPEILQAISEGHADDPQAFDPEDYLGLEKVRQKLIYFGDAQWFIRFQTFVDTVVPNLMRWIDEANIPVFHRRAFNSMNRPTQAELRTEPRRGYTADRRILVAQRRQAERDMAEQREAIDNNSLGFDLLSDSPEDSSTTNIFTDATEPSFGEGVLPQSAVEETGERGPSVVDQNIAESAKTSLDSMYYTIGPTDRVGNNPYLVSTDPTTLIIRFDPVETELTGGENDELRGRGIVVDLSENEQPGGELREEDEEVGPQKIDIRCKLDDTKDIFGEDGAYLSEGVWINVNAIQEAFLNSTTLHQGFVNLLRRINAATGHYWKLELVYDEEINQYNIVDMGQSTLESREDVEAKTYVFNERTKSEVMNLTFSSKLSKETKTLVMLTADDSELPAYGTSLYGLVLNKKPLTDLFSQELTRVESEFYRQVPDTTPQTVDRTDARTADSTDEEALSATKQSVGQVYRERFFESFNNAIRKYIGVPQYMIPLMGTDAARQLKKGETVQNNYIAPVPTETELRLTIRGIAGLAFHDVFMVDKLPTIYRDYGVFIITGLSHAVTEQGWTTTISGTYYFMWPKVEDLPEEPTTSEEAHSESTPQGNPRTPSGRELR